MNLGFYGLTLMMNILGLTVLIQAYGFQIPTQRPDANEGIVVSGFFTLNRSFNYPMLFFYF